MTGTWSLVRLILRRDRFLLPPWVMVIAVLPVVQTSGIAELYTDEAALRRFAASMGSAPAFSALYGPVLHWNAAAMGVWRAGFTPVVLALAVILTVVRHTRAEEETGRRELLGAAVLGRRAALSAALIVAGTACLAVGLIVTLSFRAYPAPGALATGLGYACVGMVFAAVAAVAAQLTESAGGARAIAISVLGLAFALRMAGDTGGTGWLSWSSPIAWGQRMRPFAGEEWWPLGLFAALVITLCALSYALAGRRDLGAGLLPPRLGPADAAPGLATPLALAWRLHRGSLAGWSAAVAFGGAVVGATAQAASGALGQNRQALEMLARLGGGAGVGQALIASVVSILGIAVSGYAIQAASRMRTEETLMRAEPLLCAAVSRRRWTASHLVFAFGGPVVVLAVLGLSAGIAYGAVTGDPGAHVPEVLGAALVQLPAVWTLSALVMALFGLLPRLLPLAWAVLAAFLVFGQVGALLDLPGALVDLSPFSHLPRLPGGEVTATPLITLVAIAAALTAAGLYGFRRRDIG
ncbi:ABC transporter permease [Streptosporangium longisporum]|uniref:Exporter of polyketide antibiotics n=1 Tax=Streptosporangium longisporum TaxID=46187 RepID=A0ABN3XPA0_9ACTN